MCRSLRPKRARIELDAVDRTLIRQLQEDGRTSSQEQLAAHDLADSTSAAAPQSGVTDLLTDRERQIAVLVTTGKRSRDVAEQLFLGKRTVDAHLARIYRKLDVSSRAALTHLLLGADHGDSV